ncbi:MAG TPA: hypothetical protein VF939_21005 [Puia sp.]
MKLYIVLFFIFAAVIGFINLIKRYRLFQSFHDFAFEYRNKFVEFANKYSNSFDRYSRTGDFDYELYTWLTKNVNRIQANLGHIGVMNYVAPFQMYQVKNYQIIINTLPKFREGKISDFDINACDDSLLRYIGSVEDTLGKIKKKIKNPFIWFKEGFQEIFNLPFYLLNWFGVLSDSALAKVTRNAFYKLATGIGALVTFASGVVTIIQGKEQTIEMIRKLWGHKW